MGTGFIVMPRGWMDNPVFGSVKRGPFSRRDAWAWLVENAAYKTNVIRVGAREVELKRGQLIATLQHLGGAWGWDTMKVSRFISAIQRARMTETTTEIGRTVITICNYEEYCISSHLTETAEVVSPRHVASATETGTKEVRKEEIPPSYEGGKRAHAREVADQMLAVWREECGDVLGNPTKASDSRITQCSARLRDLGGIDEWREFCRRIRRSWYLTEKWKATIDWVLHPANMLKIQEGNYDDDGNGVVAFGAKRSSHDAETAAFELISRS